ERRAEDHPRQRSKAESLHQGILRRAGRPLRAGRARRRRCPQAGGSRGRGRDDKGVCAQDRDVDRQLAAGEDRHCRRGRQLGTRGDGGRQGRRAGQPRQALDLVQRHPRRKKRRARSVLQRAGSLGSDEGAEGADQGVARPRQGPRPRADLRPHQGI
ncbi:hypothetical protein KXV85_004753, partial [Aspergillus fumigatus]